MKQRLMRLSDRLMLRKRAVIETVIDQLKNISQIGRVACRRQTFEASVCGQLHGERGLWLDCLLPPAQEAIHRH
jgi:hypothetical protein